MPRVPFDQISFVQKQKRLKHHPWAPKENTGLDTETFKGYARLICDDADRSRCINGFQDIVTFLTHHRFRDKFNWFYNIKFDFEAIIKWLAEEDMDYIRTLYSEHQIQYKAWEINYLDKKFFSIRDENNNYYYFFDLYNFLDTSLNNASKKFLNDEKKSDVNASLLNTDKNYWKENKEKIIIYCKYDAQLTKRLADYFWKLVSLNLNYTPKRPFSKGKLSEEYFLDRCYIPTINYFTHPQAPKERAKRMKILKYAYDSYYGGRFELIQRGYSDKVFCYDIKSAYPAELANLIDFTQGKWEKFDKKINESAYEGFYHVSINCQEAFFCPVVQKRCDLSLYPNGRFNHYLTKSEILFIESHFENVSVKIKSGYEFFPKELKFPFKSEIERLYEWKEKESDPDIKYAVKIILNSLYGKTIQISDNSRPGKLFNPFYASIITANTRTKLLKLACQKPECIIMFSTDGVHSSEPLNVPNKPGLGDFAKDFIGEGVYLMSDVYNLWNEKKTKNKLRGFSIASEKDITAGDVLLRDILANMNTPEYLYSTRRPYHLGECLLHLNKRSIHDLNVFGEVEKSINVNGDKKRIWDKDFLSGKQALKETIQSVPLVV